MATRLLGTPVPFEVIFKDGTFLLISIHEDYEYENNQKTDRLAGYRYEVVDTETFDKIRVKVKGQTNPLMTQEHLAELRKSGEKVIVEFLNGVDKLYNRRNGQNWSVEDSFSADDILIVNQD